MKWFEIYNDVSEEEVTRLLLAAGKAELRKMEPLAGGWANSTYLLTLDDDSQLVLKVWTNKTPTAVERIIRNTCWLVDHGVSTPLPLQLKDGERMLVINGISCRLIPYKIRPTSSEQDIFHPRRTLTLLPIHQQDG